MNLIKPKEHQILLQTCYRYNLPSKLVSELLKSAKNFSYENTTDSTRKKEYKDLINYYTKS